MPKFAPRPDAVKVGLDTYTVFWLNETEWVEEHLDDGTSGLTYASRQHIYVRVMPQCSESLLQKILFHELTHAAWASNMMTHVDLSEISDKEEYIIAAQSPGLLGILKDNPHVVAYLLAEGDKVR